jgi:chromosome segregation ATPase
MDEKEVLVVEEGQELEKMEEADKQIDEIEGQIKKAESQRSKSLVSGVFGMAGGILLACAAGGPLGLIMGAVAVVSGIVDQVMNSQELDQIIAELEKKLQLAKRNRDAVKTKQEEKRRMADEKEIAYNNETIKLEKLNERRELISAKDEEIAEKINSYTSKLVEDRKTVASRTTELETKKSQLNDLKSRNTSKLASVDEIKARLDALSQTKSDTSKQFLDMVDKISTLKAAKDKLKNNLADKAKDTKEASKKTLEKTLAKIESNLGGFKEAKSNQKIKLEQAEKAKSNLKAKITANN